MSANQDFADLFSELNAAEVRYLVVGAYAVVFHAEPRYTKDIDIWVEPTAENAMRVYRALASFGAPLEGVTEQDFQDSEMIYQIGIEPNRIDILMKVEGLEFEAALASAVRTRYENHEICLLSRDDLILAKKTAGRPQDLLDVERLERGHR